MTTILTEQLVPLPRCGELSTSSSGSPGDAEVISRPYGELAAALYASDMPTAKTRTAPTTAQLTTWVRQGLDRLGGDAAAWHLCQQARTAVQAKNWSAYQRIWSSKSRSARAHNLAYDIMRMADAYSYTPSLTWVLEFIEPFTGAEIRRQVDARDVAFAAQLGIAPW